MPGVEIDPLVGFVLFVGLLWVVVNIISIRHDRSVRSRRNAQQQAVLRAELEARTSRTFSVPLDEVLAWNDLTREDRARIRRERK